MTFMDELILFMIQYSLHIFLLKSQTPKTNNYGLLYLFLNFLILVIEHRTLHLRGRCLCH